MHINLRYLAAFAVGIFVTGYLVALVCGRIPSNGRIDFAAIVLVLISAAIIVLLFSERSSTIVADMLIRVRTFQVANLKVELDAIRAQQQDQTLRLELLQLLAPIVLPSPERSHLLNLHLARTTGYIGNHDVRTELRRLRYLALITNGRSVGSANDGSTFDLKDIVQLTPLGTKWAQQLVDMEKSRDRA